MIEETESLAKQLLHGYKKTNLMMFIIILILIIAFTSYVIYNEYRNNDFETTTETIEIQDIQTLDNSTIKIGDDIYKLNGDGEWEKSQ